MTTVIKTPVKSLALHVPFLSAVKKRVKDTKQKAKWSALLKLVSSESK